MQHYRLDEHGNPVFEPDQNAWAKWFETADQHVADDTVATADGEVRVSTIFLAHGFGPTPALWESKIFGGTLNQVCDRCTGSREQAQAMHAAMVYRAKGGVVPHCVTCTRRDTVR